MNRTHHHMNLVILQQLNIDIAVTSSNRKTASM